MTFGQYLRQLRTDRGFSLRNFCAEVGVGHSNCSKMERDLLPPPKSMAILEAYANVLDIEKNSSEWKEFVRLASLSRGEIPASILSNRNLVRELPTLFRLLEGEPTDDEAVQKLFATIREASHGPQVRAETRA